MRTGPSALMITLPGWTSPWHTTTSSDPTKSSHPRWRSTAARIPASAAASRCSPTSASSVSWSHHGKSVGEGCGKRREATTPTRRARAGRLRRPRPVDRCRVGFDERPRRDGEPVDLDRLVAGAAKDTDALALERGGEVDRRLRRCIGCRHPQDDVAAAEDGIHPLAHHDRGGQPPPLAACSAARVGPGEVADAAIDVGPGHCPRRPTAGRAPDSADPTDRTAA